MDIVRTDGAFGCHVVTLAALPTQPSIRPEDGIERRNELGFRCLDHGFMPTCTSRSQALLAQHSSECLTSRRIQRVVGDLGIVVGFTSGGDEMLSCSSNQVISLSRVRFHAFQVLSRQ